MHRGIWRASVCVHVRTPCRNELLLWLSSELSSTSRKLFLRAAALTYVCLHITSCYGNAGKSLDTVHCVCQVWFYVDFFFYCYSFITGTKTRFPCEVEEFQAGVKCFGTFTIHLGLFMFYGQSTGCCSFSSWCRADVQNAAGVFSFFFDEKHSSLDMNMI